MQSEIQIFIWYAFLLLHLLSKIYQQLFKNYIAARERRVSYFVLHLLTFFPFLFLEFFFAFYNNK